MTDIIKITQGEKIRKQNKQEFGHFLNHTVTLYGLQAVSTPEEKRFIFNHLTEYVGNMSWKELTEAMNMNINGDFGQKAKPYGVLSVAFIQEVLDLYRPWRQEQIQRVKKALPPPEEKEKTPQELWDILKNLHKSIGVPRIFAWDRVYLYLEKEGIISVPLDDKIAKFKGLKNQFRLQGRKVDDSIIQTECRKKEVIAILNKL